MKKRIIALLCLVLAALILASCEFLDSLGGTEQGTDEPCEHTISEKWSSSSSQHWHAATCEHSDLKFNVASHVDVDEDGLCDVCAYNVGHTHIYSNVFSYDADNHWKDAICTHKSEKTEIAPHTDSDSDGKCDVCPSHVHVENIYGYCAICGEQLKDVDIADLSEIIPTVTSNSDKISAGSIKYNYYSVSPSVEGYVSTDKLVSYRLGKSAAYYSVATSSHHGDVDSSDRVEKWYDLLDSDTVFGVYRESYGSYVGNMAIDPAASKNNLTGYYYTVSTLASAYGAENLLEELYRLAADPRASEYDEGYVDGVYFFSYNYLYVNNEVAMGEDPHVDYYELYVSFSVSESGALTYLEVVCDCYNNSLGDERDNDFVFDSSLGTITMKDGACPDTYTYEIEQTASERTYVSEYTKSDFIPDSFEFYTDKALTEQLSDIVTADLGKTFYIYLGSFSPEGTSADYIADTFEYTTDLYTWYFGGSIGIYCRTVGSYPVELTLGGVEVSFILNIVDSSPEPPVPSVPENSIRVEITGEYTYTWDTKVSFTATWSGDYTFTVPEGLGALGSDERDNFGAALIDPLDPESVDGKNGGSFTVSLLAGETFSFYTTSLTPTTAYITYSVSEYTGGQGSTDTPVIDTSKPISVGAHIITVTDADIDNEIIKYMITVTEEGTYTFLSGNMFANLYDGKGMFISRNSAYLEPGAYAMCVYVGNVSSAGQYSFTITYEAPSVEVEPEGSYYNPISIDSVPFTDTVEKDVEKYYSFDATEDCTLIISGGNVSVIDFESMTEFDDAFNPIYTTVYGVNKGDTVIFSVWSDSETVFTLTVGAPVVSGSIDKPFDLDLYSGNTAVYPIGTDDGLVWYVFDSLMTGTLDLNFEVEVDIMYGTSTDSLSSVSNVTELALSVAEYTRYYIALCIHDGREGEISFTASVSDGSGNTDTPVEPDPDPDPDPDPELGLTGLEGGFIAESKFNSNVRVLVNSTHIYIVDPEGRVVTFSYTYVDGLFEVYYGNKKLPNSGDPEFTITNGKLTAILNNGTYFTLIPTDEQIDVGGKDEPEGSLSNPIVLGELPETVTFTSDTENKIYYVFTATESGVLTLAWPTEDSWVDVYELDENGNNTANSSSAYKTDSFTFDIEAGKTYRLGLSTWDKKGETTVSISVS